MTGLNAQIATMKKTHNKLVRDNIPDIIRQAGKTPTTRIASPEEYRYLLHAKLQEEFEELTTPGANRPDELADILEIIHALSALEGLSPNQINDLRTRKALKRGAFNQRIVLLEVEE